MKEVLRGTRNAIILIFILGLGAFVVMTFGPYLTVLATEPQQPQIYTMQFGVTVSKFLIINDRLHLLVPLPVTGESSRVINISKIAKKGRKGK